jgi:hypothetical protein
MSNCFLNNKNKTMLTCILRFMSYVVGICIASFFIAFELTSSLAPLVMFPGFPDVASNSTPALNTSQFYEPAVVSDSVREGILQTHQGNSLHYVEVVPTQNIDEIDTDGHVICKAATLIFYLHGNGLSLDTRWKQVCVDLSRQTNLPVITHDYTGYGRSSSNVFDVHAVVEDAAYLMQQCMAALGKTKVVLYGRSIGAAVAVHLAERLQRMKGLKLVLETPMLGTKHLRWWLGVSMFCSEKFDCRKCLDNTTHVPLLVRLAGRDLIISNDSIIELLSSWRLDPVKICVEHNTGHNHMSQGKWNRDLLEFI